MMGKINHRKFSINDIYDITIIEIFPNKDDLCCFHEIHLEYENKLLQNKDISAYVLHYPNKNKSLMYCGNVKGISGGYKFEIEFTCTTLECIKDIQ